MARLLIVDDEPLVLDVQQQLLKRKCPEWETMCAPGGAEALEHLRGSEFDVVMADMRMPGMDGAALLAKIRDEWPSTIRIIQSGHSDRDAALRAVTAAHLFLAKPTQIAVLEEVLKRVLMLKDLLQDPSLMELVGGVRSLPSVPRVYMELTECLAREDSSIEEIAAVLRSDVAMCAKVLQVARSAFFGLPRDTTNVADAVSWLGVSLVKSLALASGVFREFSDASSVPSFSIDMEQKHALQVSHAAGKIIGRGDYSDDAIMAGMLHDVGRLVLASVVPEETQALMERAQSERRRLYDLEYEQFGVSHAEVGAYLLGLWGLPHAVVEAVAHHHRPSRVQTSQVDAVAAVHIADALVGDGFPVEDGPEVGDEGPFDTEFISRIGVEDRIGEWRLQISDSDEGLGAA